jgi:hypothetical protein
VSFGFRVFFHHDSRSITLVISADPEAYAKQLQQVVEERDHQAPAMR